MPSAVTHEASNEGWQKRKDMVAKLAQTKSQHHAARDNEWSRSNPCKHGKTNVKRF